MENEALKVLTEAGSKIVEPVYTDGLKPGVKEIGKSLETVAGIVNVALTPISLMVHGFKEIEENLKKKLSAKLASIPSAQIIPPSLSVVGPLLEKYKYNYDNPDIADLFVSLLANSMDARTANNAHPAFVDIISQLAADEARLFKNIASTPNCAKADVAVYDDKGNYNILRRNLIDSTLHQSLQHPLFVPTYIENLQRLNLIYCSTGFSQESYTDKTLYESIRGDAFVKRLEAAVSPTQRVELFEGHIRLTDFGITFNNAVTREE